MCVNTLYIVGFAWLRLAAPVNKHGRYSFLNTCVDGGDDDDDDELIAGEGSMTCLHVEM